MANSTSKSTKAKTKTIKKPVAASKKVAAKVTKPSTKALKEIPKKTSAKSDTGEVRIPESVSNIKNNQSMRRVMDRLLTAEGLRKAYLVSALVFAVLAALAGALMNDTGYQLLRGYLTSDSLLSQGGSAVFGPAQHVVGTLELRWFVAVTMLVSAVLALWRYRNVTRERQALANRISPWRWVDVAITGALMVQVVAFLSGMHEIVALLLTGALVAASAVFSWIAERENAGATTMVRGALSASFVTGAFVALAINSFAVATPVYGMVRSPWYVYALYVLGLVAALALALIQVRQYRRLGAWANYMFVDRSYMLLNFATKVLFALILIIGLHK